MKKQDVIKDKIQELKEIEKKLKTQMDPEYDDENEVEQMLLMAIIMKRTMLEWVLE